VAKPPLSTTESSSPGDFPKANPRDLHPTTDIRFVIVEIAKLTTLIDRLLSDVSEQQNKLDELRQQATYIKGGLAVGAIFIGFFGWFFSQVIDGKMQTILSALATIQK
jgi:uncharacterized membrane protein YjjP (DUF1212 family)